MKISNLTLGRYDFAAYASFTAYALCSLAIPIVIVSMAKDLDFPLAEGGMAQGGKIVPTEGEIGNFHNWYFFLDKF